MTDCAIRLKAKPTVSEAERSRRLAATARIYQIILEALREAAKEQRADGTEQ